MGDSKLKEVNYVTYCESCKHKDKNDYESPCNECLEAHDAMREGTEVPVMWEAKKGNKS